MAKVKILNYPDPRLKKNGQPVNQLDDATQQVISDMFETHYATHNCAALAATQLDFQKPLAITVIDYSQEKNEPMCLINPEIIDASGEQFEFEGCMSVYPDVFHEKVKRAQWIKVRAMDEKGDIKEFEAEGYLAKCIQHEIDHLHGLLFLDRLSPVKRKMVEQKIKKHIKRLGKKS